MSRSRMAGEKPGGVRAALVFVAAVVGVVGVVVVLLARPAHAHFFLDAPPSWMSQTPPPGFGDPQKTGPCGDEGGGTPTGIVTQVTPQANGTYRVTVMWHDTVAHPGHYRIALAVNSRSELPAEPTVTPTAADQCASAAVASAPYSLPLLADNVNPHPSMALQGPQMVTVTIPANVVCAHCTLQVLEFMSSHGAPCFYHHCADLSMGTAASGTGGAGAGGTAGRAGGGGATGSGASTGSGGSTGTGGGSTSAGGASTGSGGIASTGGSGAATGGRMGSGGSLAGSGGSTAVAVDGGKDAASAASNSGCSCSSAPVNGSVRGAHVAILLGLGLGAVSRRRRYRYRRPAGHQ